MTNGEFLAQILRATGAMSHFVSRSSYGEVRQKDVEIYGKYYRFLTRFIAKHRKD